MIKILSPYCDFIKAGNKHIKAYPKNTKSVIVVSSTSGDRNFTKQVFRDFRRLGIIIEELK